MTFIIDDNTDIHGHTSFYGGMCGCQPSQERYGSAANQTIPIVPWDEMPDRISDQEKHKSSLYHMWLDSGLGVFNQQWTNYCWGFCTGSSLLLGRASIGAPPISLSPSSVAAPVVNFSNSGYFIAAALKRLVSDGMATTEFVPEVTTNSRDFKPGYKESAARNKVVEWAEVGADAQMQCSALLANYPLPVEHGWWGHAVCHGQLLDRYPKMPANNPMRYGRRFMNSWGKTYGENGWGIVEGQRAIADAAWAMLQATFVG